MRISQKLDYACRALLYLAQRHDGSTVLRSDDIAKAEAIPLSFLAQILHELRKHGFVTSRRGKSGGWILSGDPAKITILAIVEAIDPGLLENPANKEGVSAVTMNHFWESLREEFRKKMELTTLESINSSQSSPMYFI